MVSKHDEITDALFFTLDSRGRWDRVNKEVEIYRTPKKHRLCCVPDILTERRGVAVYWEIKSGVYSNGIKNARRQSKNWFEHMARKHPHTNAYFVTYNPRAEHRPMIGRFRRYHASKVLDHHKD